MTTAIRPARAEDAADLSALCMRSKAHWGYDDDFLRKCETELTITPERIGRGRVLVAEDASGALLGMAAAEPLADGTFDLALLFIDPKAILESIRSGEKEYNEERKQRGFPPIHADGWSEVDPLSAPSGAAPHPTLPTSAATHSPAISAVVLRMNQRSRIFQIL